MRRKFQSESNIPVSPATFPDFDDGDLKKGGSKQKEKEDYYYQQQENIQREMLAFAKQQKEATSTSKKQKKLSVWSRDYWALLGGVFILTFFLAIPFLYILLTRLGIGHYFPNQTEYLNMKPLLPESSLEVVAKLQFPPGNVAVSSEGRIFFSFHPEFSPPVSVAELHPSSEETLYTPWTPFPSGEFQRNYHSVLSVHIDRQSRLWLLDFAHHAIQASPALYAFQLASGGSKTDNLVVSYTFPSDVAGFGSMLNDFQVDPTGEFVYIIDTSILALTPAIIVYSVSANRAYRMLQGHTSLFGSSAMIQIYGSVPSTVLRFGPLGMQIHADSIALDRTGSRFYYGALTSNRLYSINTNNLLGHVRRLQQINSSSNTVADKALQEYVRLVTTEKPITDGLTSDSQGNLWLTAVEHSSLFLALPKIPKETSVVGVTDVHSLDFVKVVSSPSLLRWPDGFSFGPDGLYVTNSALHLKFSRQNATAHRPFHIVRLPTREIAGLRSVYGKRRFQPPASGH